jgi:hypothetical protein
MFANIINLNQTKNIMEGVSDSPILKYVNFYNSNEIELIDKRLPTMYVGFEYAKTIYNDIDILESKITNKEYWTFSPTESMLHFLNRSREFVKLIPDSLVIDIKYESINPFFTKEDIREKVEHVLGESKIVYKHRDSYFVYSGDTVYGIHGGFMEVFDLPIPEFKSRLLDDKDNRINDFFVEVFGYDPHTVQRYIPYLVTLKKQAAELKIAQK